MRNETYPKLKVLVYFWVQFIAGKLKILPKTRIFPETASLWLLNNTSAMSQINHRILIKLIKKIHFWGKNGLFKIKNRPVNKDQRVRGHVRVKFSEAPNPWLTIGQGNFVVAPVGNRMFETSSSFRVK